ncbi:MAG TPA: hypothetical protein VGN85_09630 [Methyloceanibacter sp.]|nr:hypothetical protein [Methyloceanibacter sp.]
MEKFRNRYRPELHYMRGPGPKWREKHAAALLAAASAQHEVKFTARPAQAKRGWPLATLIVPVAAAALLGFVAVLALA